MSELVFNIIGFVGAALILLGFYRISIRRWKTTSLWYELDNLIGAVLIIVYQVHHKSYVTIFLNVIWAVVAFRGVESYAKRRRKHKRK